MRGSYLVTMGGLSCRRRGADRPPVKAVEGGYHVLFPGYSPAIAVVRLGAAVGEEDPCEPVGQEVDVVRSSSALDGE